MSYSMTYTERIDVMELISKMFEESGADTIGDAALHGYYRTMEAGDCIRAASQFNLTTTKRMTKNMRLILEVDDTHPLTDFVGLHQLGDLAIYGAVDLSCKDPECNRYVAIFWDGEKLAQYHIPVEFHGDVKQMLADVVQNVTFQEKSSESNQSYSNSVITQFLSGNFSAPANKTRHDGPIPVLEGMKAMTPEDMAAFEYMDIDWSDKDYVVVETTIATLAKHKVQIACGKDDGFQLAVDKGFGDLVCRGSYSDRWENEVNGMFLVKCDYKTAKKLSRLFFMRLEGQSSVKGWYLFEME